MWISGEPPPPEYRYLFERRMAPPDNEFPAVLGLDAMLGRGDGVAVGITGGEAFTIGFRFTLSVHLREVSPELRRAGSFAFTGTHPIPGVDISLEDRLLLGIQYADGRRASTLHDRFPFDLDTLEPTRLSLVQHRGGGGDRGVEMSYWVCPLPPDGPVSFVLSWPRFGITEARTDVDGAAIRAAGARSRVLWPPQPIVPDPEPPPPPSPPSGWFAEPPD